VGRGRKNRFAIGQQREGGTNPRYEFKMRERRRGGKGKKVVGQKEIIRQKKRFISPAQGVEQFFVTAAREEKKGKESGQGRRFSFNGAEKKEERIFPRRGEKQNSSKKIGKGGKEGGP